MAESSSWIKEAKEKGYAELVKLVIGATVAWALMQREDSIAFHLVCSKI
jgi:hypothetical protein